MRKGFAMKFRRLALAISAAEGITVSITASVAVF
jgi:hypothetical protein